MIQIKWTCDDCNKEIRININDVFGFTMVLDELKKKGMRQVRDDANSLVDVCPKCAATRDWMKDEDSIDLLEDDESVLSDLDD